MFNWKLLWINPEIRKLAQNNHIKAYSLPQGQISLLFRGGRGSPGLISKVGLNTYVDPKIRGGKINELTKDDMSLKLKLITKIFYSINQF